MLLYGSLFVDKKTKVRKEDRKTGNDVLMLFFFSISQMLILRVMLRACMCNMPSAAVDLVWGHGLVNPWLQAIVSFLPP